MTTQLTAQDRSSFYAAAVLGLRALDTPARRFGSDADARWAQFAGSLGAGDRIDILLRDAAGTWGAAFSPSECFGFPGLADDEPFGPDWGGIDDHAAKKLLAGSTSSATLDAIAAALGVEVTSVAVPSLTTSTKLVVAGGAAMVAVARAFASNRALKWTHQVLAIADRSTFRQLASLAAVLLGADGRTVMVRSSEGANNALRALSAPHIDLAVVSPDAEPNAAALARTVGDK